MSSKLPILILAYNRPDLVAQVMVVAQIYQPSRIYLACDGPRLQKQGDKERVEDVQRVMRESVNWDCEMHTLFRDHNLGCAQGVYEAITWFFENEEYGVILEDDVIVSQDFFKLCEDLLPRYKNERRIMQIVSRNTSRRTDIPNTYVYTQSDSCWGWATWRRAWKCMDMTMSGVKMLTIPYLIKRWGLFKGCMWYYYFNHMYTHINQSNSWATRWALSITCHDGLVICPGVNMGINIGMSSGEHYAENANSLNPAFRYELQSMSWPLKYNDTKLVDKKQKRYDSKFFLKERLFGLIHKKWL
jgi:hypothetical protein